jgi:uncharacterized MAPEG superfamily protein
LECNHPITVELGFFAASIILGLLQLIATSHLISVQYGYRRSASNREQPMPPLRGIASRIDQATTNFLETFPFFAALVLATHMINRHGAITAWGANLYFWGRLGYVLAAAAGYGLVRSMIFWNVALTGIVLLLVALFL